MNSNSKKASIITTPQEVDRQLVLEKLNWRYAVKKFDKTKKIPDADWEVLAQSLRLSPSSYGLQPWKFLVVRNPAILKELTAVTWKQTQVEDCSHYVVFTTPHHMTEEHVQAFVDKTAEVRNLDPATLTGFYEMMVKNLVHNVQPEVSLSWMQRQAYIAMGFLMETAAMLNIDTCAIEGLDPAAYDRILRLPEKGWKAVAAVACGYRHADDKYQLSKKVRFDLTDIVQFID